MTMYRSQYEKLSKQDCILQQIATNEDAATNLIPGTPAGWAGAAANCRKTPISPRGMAEKKNGFRYNRNPFVMVSHAGYACHRRISGMRLPSSANDSLRYFRAVTSETFMAAAMSSKLLPASNRRRASAILTRRNSASVGIGKPSWA